MREHQPCVAVFASEKDQVGSKRPLSDTEEPLPVTPSSQATTLAMGATPKQKAKAGLFNKIWEFVFDPTRLLILHVSLGMLAPMVRERRQCRKAKSTPKTKDPKKRPSAKGRVAKAPKAPKVLKRPAAVRNTKKAKKTLV